MTGIEETTLSEIKSDQADDNQRAESGITEVKAGDLVPDIANANQHTPRGEDMVQRSIHKHGFRFAGTLDKDNRIVHGNNRHEQAGAIGLDDVVIVEADPQKQYYLKFNDLDLADDDNPARELAYMANRSAQVSINFSPETLAIDIAAGVDLSGMFKDTEVEEILAELVEEKPLPIDPPIDKAEELQEKWQCQLGQIWQVESQANPGHYHRLICGDCRDIETVERLVEGRKVNGIFTSPPYAMQRAKQYGGTLADEYVEWWEAAQENMRAVLAEDGSFFVNIKPHCKDGQRVLYVFDLVLAMVRRWGWRFIDELCWYRGGYPGRWANRLKNEFEPVYHFSLSSIITLKHQNVIKEFAPSSLSDKLTVYDGLDNAPASGGSPFKQKWKKSAEFDGALPGNVLKLPHSETAKNTGAFQAAPFPLKLPTSGSGTVGCAAENEGRLSMMVEQLPKYCAVILERLQTHIGNEPSLISEPQ